MEAVYIHIPFCETICSYCDFSKMFYRKKWIMSYLEALKREIHLNYRGEEIKSIYIGGGTPSCLDVSELEYLLNILKIFNVSNDLEYTIECNLDIALEKISLFKNYGINRISLGVQSFLDKNLKLLGRNHHKSDIFNVINLFKKNGFDNINVDLIYALPNQTLEDLEKDLDYFIQLNVPHISTYSLIIEPHTKLYIDKVSNIDEEIDLKMYHLICKKLAWYKHYEISNFAKEGYFSKHNLGYWNNLEYYGFGLGASGYIDGVRYTNTKSLNQYLSGEYVLEANKLSLNTKIENEFILGFRKVEGISITKFKEKYHLVLEDIKVVKKLLLEGKLIKIGDNIMIKEDLLYVSNDILIDFVGENYEER